MALEIVWKDRKRTFLGLPWSFTKYSLTEDRLFIETGLFKSVENETRLYRILDLRLERSLGQKLFGLGTIIITSSDKNLGTFELKNIKNPKEIKETIADMVEKQRDAKRVVGREYINNDDDVNCDCDHDDYEDDETL